MIPAPRPRAAAAILLAALLAPAAATHALGRPDWAIPFLSLPTPTGTYIAPADSWVVVYEEVHYDLSATGRITEQHRSIIENMTDQEATFARFVEYDEGQQQISGLSLAVQRSVLWHDINVDQKSVQGGEAGATRFVVTGAEKIAPRHRVVWEYTLSDKLGFMPWDHALFPEGLPVAKKRIQVSPEAAAKGLTLRLMTPGGAPPPASFAKEADGSWTATSIPASSRIPADLVFQPESCELYPYALVTLSGEDQASWTTFAQSYSTAWTDAAAKVDTKQLGEYAAGLCKGLSTSMDKARRLAAFVQDDIQYDDSNERAMSAWLPLAPEESLRSMKADCKGKVMLLTGLLGTQGIEAVPILLRSSDRYFAWGSHVASARFNHVICAVNLPGAGTPLPATLTEGPLKGWVLFDPTDQGYRIGEPLPGHEGLPAFSVAAGKVGSFILHTATPSVESTQVQVKTELLSTDDLIYDLAVSDNGGSPLMQHLLASFSDEKTKTYLVDKFTSATSARLALTPSAVTRASADPSGRATFKGGFIVQHGRQELTASSLIPNPMALVAIVSGIPNGLARRDPPTAQERIELTAPWDAKLNASGRGYEVSAKASLVLGGAFTLTPPAPREEDRPWLQYACTWKKTGDRTWECSFRLSVPRGTWTAADRKTRLQVVDELFRGLYAPLMLSKGG